MQLVHATSLRRKGFKSRFCASRNRTLSNLQVVARLPQPRRLSVSSCMLPDSQTRQNDKASFVPLSSSSQKVKCGAGVPRRQRHVEEDGYAEERARDLDSEREQEAQHAERRERKKRRKEKKLKMEKRRREERYVNPQVAGVAVPAIPLLVERLSVSYSAAMCYWNKIALITCRAEFSTHRARDDYAERPRSGRR